MTEVICRIPKSKSMDAVSQVDYELAMIDCIDIRNKLEKYVGKMIKLGVVCADSLRNRTMKAKLLSQFMDENDIDYVKAGEVVGSMFENVIQCNVGRIELHSKINLTKYFSSGIVSELSDDAYLHQSLMLMHTGYMPPTY